MQNTREQEDQVLMPVTGAKIYKLNQQQWQVVTPSSAQTISCPELLLEGLVKSFGKLTRAQFIEDMAATVEQATSASFVDTLLARDMICLKSRSQLPALSDRFFYLLPTPVERKNQLLLNPQEHTLRLHGEGCLYNEVKRSAEAAGYQIQEPVSNDTLTNQPVSLCLVLSDRQSHDVFRRINREHIIPEKRPTIFSYLDGANGRLFRVIPSATACFECLHHRIRVGKTFFREFDAASSGNALWFEDVLPAPQLQAQQLAATIIMQASLMLVNGIPDLHEGNLIELPVFSESKRVSSILKLPRCEVCGSGNTQRPPAPIYNPAPV